MPEERGPRVSNDWCINKNKNVLPSILDTPAWSSELLDFGRLLGGEEQFLSLFIMTVHLVSFSWKTDFLGYCSHEGQIHLSGFSSVVAVALALNHVEVPWLFAVMVQPIFEQFSALTGGSKMILQNLF